MKKFATIAVLACLTVSSYAQDAGDVQAEGSEVAVETSKETGDVASNGETGSVDSGCGCGKPR